MPHTETRRRDKRVKNSMQNKQLGSEALETVKVLAFSLPP